MSDDTRRTLSLAELAGFAAIIGAFVVVMLVLDLEGQSWGSFALLAAALVALFVYRALLRRRRS